MAPNYDTLCPGSASVGGEEGRCVQPPFPHSDGYTQVLASWGIGTSGGDMLNRTVLYVQFGCHQRVPS